MDVIETIKIRRSIRVYKDKPIPKDVLEKIVDAGRFAATARNIQPWEFIVVTNPEVLRKLGEITGNNGRFIAQAASCIAVFCQDTKYYLEDGCAATQNILLAASSLGIGSCWVAGDKKDYAGEVGSLLGAPPAFKLISLIALGYPELKKDFQPPEKRGLKEVLHWDNF